MKAVERLREVETASVQRAADYADLQAKLTVKERGMATLSSQLTEVINTNRILQTDLEDAQKQIASYKRQTKSDVSSSPTRPHVERDLTPFLGVSPQL